MASISTRHSYRFGYLKSEHWSNLRISKLAECDAVCELCAERSLSNDVHHIHYRQSLYDTKLSDLVVLCRTCHQCVHGEIEKGVGGDVEGFKKKWKKVRGSAKQEVTRKYWERVSVDKAPSRRSAKKLIAERLALLGVTDFPPQYSVIIAREIQGEPEMVAAALKILEAQKAYGRPIKVKAVRWILQGLK